MSAVLLIIFSISFFSSLQPLIEPDFGWHLRTGDYILSHLTLPTGDPLLNSFPHYPYVYHSWLSELFYSLSYHLAGIWGTTIMFAFIFASSMILLCFTSLKLKPTRFSLLVLVFTLPLIFSLVVHRTQAFSFLFFCLLHYLLTSARLHPQTKRLNWHKPDHFLRWLHLTHTWVVPLLFLVWVNLHGGFFLGLAYIFLTSILSFFTRTLETHPTPHSFPLFTFFLGTLALVTTFINPYFYRIHLMSLSMASNSYLHLRNTDWYPIQYLTKPGLVLHVCLLILLFSTVTIFVKHHYLHKLLLAGFFLGLFFSLRLILPFIAILLPFLPLLASQLDNHLNPTKRHQLPIYLGIISALLIFLSHSTTTFFKTIRAYQDPQYFSTYAQDLICYPYPAIKHLSSRPASNHLFNSIMWGGYLKWQLPHQTIFADGKMDFYFINGDTFLNLYFPIVLAQPGWQQTLTQFSINSILIEPDTPLAQALSDSPDWTLKHQDQCSVYYTRNQPLPLN